MFFLTVELVKTKLIPTDVWRLQTDGTWRSVKKNTVLAPTDQKFDDARQVLPYYKMNLELKAGSDTVLANPTEGDLLGVSYHVEARVHRIAKPHFPTKQELIDTIVSGNDSHDNSLILTLEGRFELLNRDLVDVVYNPTIAVRYETFNAGNDYVGPKAAQDQDFIDDTYHAMLFHWVSHLKGDRVNIYADYDEPVGEEKLIEQIDKLTAELR